MRARYYVADLGRLGALCEGNYLRLQRLLGVSSPQDGVCFDLSSNQQYLGRIRMRMLQSSRYTDTVLLEQTHASGRWLNDPHMTVRIYHDARMAEVISCFRNARIEILQDYPNRFMHHPDEKVQVNAFLAEWLSFCLRCGHVRLSPECLDPE